jgi:azurin
MTTKKLFGISVLLFILAAYILITVPKADAATTSSCTANVESTDTMQFSTNNITIPKSCKEFIVNLKHTGTMPKNIMGHNLVITKATDEKQVLNDAAKAGAKDGYIKANDKRVLMATSIIGGGESTTAKLRVDRLNTKEAYVFFCTFPGHNFMMKGAVKVV